MVKIWWDRDEEHAQGWEEQENVEETGEKENSLDEVQVKKEAIGR